MSGPYPHDDRFAVRFLYDVTDKPSGKRFTMDEVGLFTVVNGKITREEFFYPHGWPALQSAAAPSRLDRHQERPGEILVDDPPLVACCHQTFIDG